MSDNMPIPPDRHYRLQPDVRFRVLSGEAVVVKQDANQVMILNEVGTFALPYISQGLKVEEIVTRITEAFEVNDKLAKKDFHAFLQQLTASGIITADEDR